MGGNGSEISISLITIEATERQVFDMESNSIASSLLLV
jgi:hypothetical protein